VIATLGGVANQVCSDCTSLNANWNLSTLSNEDCLWQTEELSTGLCGLTIDLIINADLVDTGGFVLFSLKVHSGLFVVAQWTESYSPGDGHVLLQALCDGESIDLGTADTDLTTACAFGSATANIALDV